MRATQRYNLIISAVEDERDLCLKDRRFATVKGAQWEGDLSEQFENSPKMEFNKIKGTIKRINSEYRNNRITVDYTDRNSKDTDLDDLCDGLYRADEEDYGAVHSYDNCFNDGITGGMGAWKLVDVYADDEDEDDNRQRISFVPIHDPESTVFHDLNAKQPDKSDAKHAFHLASITREAYIEKYDDNPSSWSKPIDESYFDWSSTDGGMIYLAEYYEVVEEKDKIFIYRHIDDETEKVKQSAIDEDPSILEELEAVGAVLESTKKIKRQRVKKYLISGGGKIVDHGYIAGKYIPIIVFFAERDVIDGVERIHGVVRYVDDAQRLENMLKSKLAEEASLESREKPIVTPEQILDHEDLWANDNLKKNPFLLINETTGPNGEIITAPLNYTRVSQMSPATATLIQTTANDLKEGLGDHQAAERLQSGVSGVATEMVHNKFDMQTFIYMSNLRTAMKYCGDVWVSKAADLYVETSREMKASRKSGTTENVTLNIPALDKEGALYMKNDISKANISVVATVSPSSTSRKSAMVKDFSNLLQYVEDPAERAVIIANIVTNMDGEGLGPTQEYYRKKLVAAGVEEPTEQDKEEQAKAAEAQQNAPADPNTQFMEASAREADANAMKAQADAQNKVADTELKAAQVEKTKAQTIETLSDIERDDIKAASEMMDQMAPDQPILNDRVVQGQT